MKLGINGWRILGHHTGVGRYLYNILRHWTPENVDGRFSELTLYTHLPYPTAEKPLPPTIHNRVLGPAWRMLIWENLRLGPAAADDLTYHPSFSIPLWRRGQSVVVIHEVIHELYPQLFPASVRLFYKHLYRWSARQSTLVISGSEASKQDIIRQMKLPPDKIRVVPMAAADFFHRPPEQSVLDAVRTKYLDAQTPFFLFVGKLSGRRSLPLLLGGFAEFKKQSRLPHKLVVVGLNIHKVNVAQMIEELGISGEVIYPGFISDDDLNGLYHQATGLISPALYEPICLPVMEAQAAGTPVICSDSPGMREATGGHALLLPKPEVAEMAKALTQLAQDDDLCRRLSQNGRQYAQQFSWERTSKETLNVLAEAIKYM
jgi:glycosyltransferase involved in cell wall biosynthesis